MQFSGKKVSEVITDKIATIGENLSLRRISKFLVIKLFHMCTMLRMVWGNNSLCVKETIKIWTASCYAYSCFKSTSSLKEDLDPSIIDREKSVLTEQAKESGKPEQVIEKMIEGRMKKFFPRSAFRSRFCGRSRFNCPSSI